MFTIYIVYVYVVHVYIVYVYIVYIYIVYVYIVYVYIVYVYIVYVCIVYVYIVYVCSRFRVPGDGKYRLLKFSHQCVLECSKVWRQYLDTVCLYKCAILKLINK